MRILAIVVLLACLETDAGRLAAAAASYPALTSASKSNADGFGPLHAALADDDAPAPGEYSIFGQREYTPICKCMLIGKLGDGSIPDTVPASLLRECVNDGIDGCRGSKGMHRVPHRGMTARNAKFEASVCQTFDEAGAYINTFGFMHDFEVLGGGGACAFDRQLHDAVQSACWPVCVPGANHTLRSGPLAEYLFSAPLNKMWWETGLLEECTDSHHPFSMCDHKNCIRAMEFYESYHKLGLSDCEYRDMFMDGHVEMTQLLRGACGSAAQIDAPANVTLFEQLQTSAEVFDEAAWTEQVRAFNETGDPMGLQAQKPNFAALTSTIMENAPKVCKHLYEFSDDEVMLLMQSTQAPADVQTKLAGVDGPTLVSMDKDDMMQLDIDVRWYAQWLRNLKFYLSPSIPESLDRRGSASTIQVDVNIINVFNIDEENYTFEAQFEVTLMWTDVCSWVTCKAEIHKDGSVDETGDACKHMWRPNLRFENAREIEVIKRHIWSEADLKIGGSFMLIQGKFFTSMSFKQYPHDAHVVSIAFAATDVSGVGVSSDELVWSPVRSCYFSVFKSNDNDCACVRRRLHFRIRSMTTDSSSTNLTTCRAAVH